jgi:hypothetical protein
MKVKVSHMVIGGIAGTAMAGLMTVAGISLASAQVSGGTTPSTEAPSSTPAPGATPSTPPSGQTTPGQGGTHSPDDPNCPNMGGSGGTAGGAKGSSGNRPSRGATNAGFHQRSL